MDMDKDILENARKDKNNIDKTQKMWYILIKRKINSRRRKWKRDFT